MGLKTNARSKTFQCELEPKNSTDYFQSTQALHVSKRLHSGVLTCVNLMYCVLMCLIY